MPDITDLSAYTEQVFGGEDASLRTMREEAEAAGLPSIQAAPELARLLPVLVLAGRVRRILEIGTLFGYSGVILARSLPADGELVTLEVNPAHAEAARRNFARAGVATRVTIEEGPALESLQRLNRQRFDLVFIDADKASYPHYLEAALRLTGPGSIIVADNVWRSGDVASSAPDEAATAVSKFNKMLAADRRLRTAIFPTHAGRDAASISVVQE